MQSNIFNIISILRKKSNSIEKLKEIIPLKYKVNNTELFKLKRLVILYTDPL